MRFFLDTEFIEDGSTIDLISIGLVWEGGEYYAISTEFDGSKASDWVQQNVLNQLPDREKQPQFFKSRAEIAQDIRNIVQFYCELSPAFFEEAIGSKFGLKSILGVGIADSALAAAKSLTVRSKPSFYGYYSDYDWVVFCQLFGRMIDLPEGFPMYCRDIKQIADEMGNPRLPEQTEGKHNALEDAKWTKRAYEYLVELQRILFEPTAKQVNF